MPRFVCINLKQMLFIGVVGTKNCFSTAFWLHAFQFFLACSLIWIAAMPLAFLQETYIVHFESEAVAETLSIISFEFSIDVCE